jgi:hypothetical protein
VVRQRVLISPSVGSNPAAPAISINQKLTELGASPSGKAAGFDLAIRWFESSRPCQSLFRLVFKNQYLIKLKAEILLQNSIDK